MSADWSSQVALVTGAGRGIGRAAAERFARLGAAVVVNYAHSAEKAEALAASIRAAGGRAVAIGADVADAGQMEAMVARAERELGPVTILVNNAGIGWPASLETYEPEGFERMRAVNVLGVIHGIRAVMAGMKARKYGRIVNISSVAGHGNTGFVGNHFYAANKAEVNMFTRRFAIELGPHGITVNAVAPGLTRSDMTEGKRSPEEWQALVSSFAKFTILGRAGETEEIANAITFLASPESGFITAQVLTVDGGRTDYIAHG